MLKKFLIFVLALVIFVVGFGVAALSITSDKVHYHANISIFVDGKKINLNEQKYMEDASRCKLDPSELIPEDRVHFHDNNGEIVHVHARAATWGHLLSNIRWNFGKEFIVDDTGIEHKNSESKKLTFILNGSPVDNPFNMSIKSEDRLLIHYGSEDEKGVLELFSQVAKNAGEYNTKLDPASCAWNSVSFEMISHYFN